MLAFSFLEIEKRDTYKMSEFSLFKYLFVYLFMRQGAGAEPLLGKRGIGILCSGVSGSCEPSDVDASSHTQVF